MGFLMGQFSFEAFKIKNPNSPVVQVLLKFLTLIYMRIRNREDGIGGAYPTTF